MNYKVRVFGNVVETEESGATAVYGRAQLPTLACDVMDCINRAVENDYTDLVEYIDRNSERGRFLQAVVSIKAPKAVDPDNDKFIFEWIVETSRELNIDEKDALLDYIHGQSSDGWGEGFEQRPVGSTFYAHRHECYDCRTAGCDFCDGEGWITENIEKFVYAHPLLMFISEEFQDKYESTIEVVE